MTNKELLDQLNRVSMNITWLHTSNPEDAKVLYETRSNLNRVWGLLMQEQIEISKAIGEQRLGSISFDV